MAGLGFPEFLALLLPISIYALAGFVAWKFYSVLVRIDQNLAAIRREIEQRAGPALDR